MLKIIAESDKDLQKLLDHNTDCKKRVSLKLNKLETMVIYIYELALRYDFTIERKCVPGQ